MKSQLHAVRSQLLDQSLVQTSQHFFSSLKLHTMKSIVLLFPLLTAQLLSAQEWHLTGNAGTVTGTNFVGTTDANALMFKVNSQKAGYLDFSSAKANTAFGYKTLNSNKGINNAAFGYLANFSNTKGSANSAFGAYALGLNTTGYSNVAFGAGAMYKNIVGHNLIAIGDSALYNQTGTDGNVALGSKALYSNTGGGNNTALGNFCLRSNQGSGNTAGGSSTLMLNTSGSNNTGFGLQNLAWNTTGSNNTAAGNSALYLNKDADNNTAFGAYALFQNTDGPGNTAVGSSALYKNAGGTWNTAVGLEALYNNVTGGDENVAVGHQASAANTTGYYNTSLGSEALATVTSGWGNTGVGSYAGVAATAQNSTALGFAATAPSSNYVRIGNTSITVIGGQVGWSNLSDGRFKKEINQNVPGLAFINKLNPVTYKVNQKKLDEFLGKDIEYRDKNYRPDYSAADKKLRTGFIAQEVEKAAKEINYDFDGVNAPQNDKENYSLVYGEFVVPLVKAVQELSAANDAKDAKIDALQQQINELKAMIISGDQNNAASTSSLKVPRLNDANIGLQQNVPNPFNHITTISYVLPQAFSSAKIVVINKAGAVLKEISLSANGKGSFQIDAATLASGAYTYSLYVDGKLVDSKQMGVMK